MNNDIRLCTNGDFEVVRECVRCGAPCEERDYCHGCGCYVCTPCDPYGVDLAFGRHDPEEHWS